MKKMSRRTALKVMGAGILGLAGMAAWNRDQIIAFLDRDAAAHEDGDDSVQVKRRLYPASGTELSLLGFGAMRLPTRHGEINEELAQMNYLDWNEPDEAPDGARQGGSLYRKAMEKHTPCFVMEPVKGGRLADISSSAESVLRARQPDWSPAAWALRYVASFPGVVTLLSGMSTLAQVVENVQTMADFEPLTPVERRALAMSLGGGAGSAIDCTYCRYCDPCPYGVDIAGTFHVYNTWAERLHLGEGEEATASASERAEFLRHYHNEVAKKARADMCIHCDECLPKCPQHLPIPDLLAKINQLAGAAGGKEASA